MKCTIRNSVGAIIAESAIALPIFFFLIFSLIEFTRAVYIQNTLGVAAQQAASNIAINAKKSPGYNLTGFSNYVNNIRFPGSVVNSGQFSFQVVDVNNNNTVTNNQADGTTSTKVIVTVTFPPPDNSLKLPIVDPGNLIGTPIFGAGGVMFSGTATAFLERSRRPILN